MYKCCDIEALIELYPHAVIFLFRIIILAFARALGFAPKLCSSTLLALAVYMSGLTVLEKKQTQKRIAKKFGHVSHDTLNRLPLRIMPFYRHVSQCLLRLILLFSKEGWLILDDCFIPKRYATWITGAYYHFDHTERRCLVGHRLVVVLWTNGTIRIPIAFSLWHKKEYTTKYRSKNQIARILVYWVCKKNIPFAYLTFDNWYASKQNLSFFRKLNISFVTRLRKNSWLKWGDMKLTTLELSKQHAISQYHYYRNLRAYVRSYVVTYPRFGKGLLAVVKNDRHDEPGKTKFLFTSDLTLVNREIVLRYRSRWTIEEFFKDCKQYLGLSACQARELYQVLFHIRMVFLTSIISDLLKVDDTQTLGDVQSNLRSLIIIKVSENQPFLAKILPEGKIVKTTLKELFSPIRTRLQLTIEDENPVII